MRVREAFAAVAVALANACSDPPDEMITGTHRQAVLGPLGAEFRLTGPALRPVTPSQTEVGLMAAGNGSVMLTLDTLPDHHGVLLGLRGEVLGPDPMALLSGVTRSDVAFCAPDYCWAYSTLAYGEAQVQLRRLDATGAWVRDPLVIATVGSNPVVSASNDTVVVAWSVGAGPSQALWMRFVGSDGSMLPPVQLSAAAAPFPVIASSPSGHLLAWPDRQTGNVDARMTRIDAQGQILDPGGTLLIGGAGDQWPGPAYWDGSTYLVQSGASLIPVDENGTIGAGLTLPVPGFNAQSYLAPSPNGWLFLHVTASAYPGDPQELYVQRTDSALVPIEPPTQVANHATHVASTWNGQQYVFAFSGRPLTFLGQATPVTTATLDPAQALSSLVLTVPTLPKATRVAQHASPDVAFDGQRWLATWRDDRSGEWQTLCAFIDSGGVGVPFETGLAASTDGNNGPWVASDGNTSFVFQGVWGTRLDGSGTILDAPPLDIIAGGSIAAGAGQFLVTQELGDPLLTTLVSSDGTTLQGSIPTGFASFAKATWGGSLYLVTWVSDDAFWAARMSTDGSVLDAAPFPLYPWTPGTGTHTVASDGENFLVVWADARLWNGADMNRGALFAGRVTPQGELLDGNGVLVADTPLTDAAAHVVFDGTNYVIFWQDTSFGAQGGTLFAARVSPMLEVIDTVPMVVAGDPVLHSNVGGIATDAQGRTILVYEHTSGAGGYTWSMGRMIGEPAALGASCVGAEVCESGFCIDGVCCEDDCSGGDPTDCRSCGNASGLCLALPAGTVCRAASSACDVAETCDGASGSCPSASIDQCTPPEGDAGTTPITDAASAFPDGQAGDAGRDARGAERGAEQADTDATPPPAARADDAASRVTPSGGCATHVKRPGSASTESLLAALALLWMRRRFACRAARENRSSSWKRACLLDEGSGATGRRQC